jgi:general secretion pathway protein C
MEKILTKHFWTINLVTLGMVAYLLADGSSELAATKLASLLPQTEDNPSTMTPKKLKLPQITNSPNGDAILGRNIFDSEIGPIDRFPPVEISTDETTEEVDTGALPLVPCANGTAKVLATVASKVDQSWSFASIQEGKETRLYRVGDKLASREVSGITWRYLFLRGSSDECYIDLFDDGTGNKPVVAKKPKTPSKKEAPKGASSIEDRIQKVSDTETIVERSLVNELLADPTRFVRTVRVRPYKKAGKTVGYKLRRFQPNSPLALLGAQKGDIIHSVNGAELTSVDKALSAYQALRTENDVTFSITRNGKPMDLKVSIR